VGLPYSDKDMIFDEEIMQYILTEEVIMNNLFIDEHIVTELQTNKRFKALLLEVSDDIYDFIYAHTKRSSINQVEQALATNEEFRKAILRAMLYQIRYTLRSGGSLLKDQHGVDIERSKRLDYGELRRFDHIAPQAERMLMRKIIYSGDWSRY